MSETAPTIIVTIFKKEQRIESKVLNVVGQSCVSLVAPLDKLGQVTLDEHTPEFYEEQGLEVPISAKE